MENIVTAYQQEFFDRQPQLAAHDLPWLTGLRQAGIESFGQQGFPTQKVEAWRYTSIATLLSQHLPAAKPGSVSSAVIEQASLLSTSQSYRLVFIDGVYQPQLGHIGKLPKGVVLASLSTGYTQSEVAANLGLLAKPKHAFTALNQAFSQSGCYLFIPEGVQVAQPIEVICVSTQPTQSIYLRHLMIIGEHSQATVIENYISTCQQLYLNNCVTEVVLQKQAHLQHYKLQQEVTHAAHIGTTYVQQQAQSKLQAYSFNFGGKLVRSDIQVTLAGEHAECHLEGLYLASQRQHIDQHTEVIHQQANTASRENYQGILDGSARGVFNGRIEVQPAAQKTDAQLQNKNLLLSKEAEIDTKPELEIYADDVKCAHGATVSQLDEQAIFYLRSRGIDLESARSTLIYAFAAQRLAGVENDGLRQGLKKQLLRYLPITLTSQELL